MLLNHPCLLQWNATFAQSHAQATTGLQHPLSFGKGPPCTPNPPDPNPDLVVASPSYSYPSSSGQQAAGGPAVTPFTNISNHPQSHMNIQDASARFLDQVDAARSKYRKDIDVLKEDNEQLQQQRRALQADKETAMQETHRARQAVEQTKAELAETRSQLSKAKLELEDARGCQSPLSVNSSCMCQ